MKKTWQCPKCQGRKIGYLSELYDSGGSSGGDHARNLGYGLEKTGMLSVRMVQSQVEAFVCTECGFFEEYVQNPQAVDWEKLDSFRWCQR